MLQRNSAVRLIQSTGSSAQIFEIFAVMPDAVISAVVADGLYGETVGGKRLPVIDQMRFWCDDLKGIICIYYAEGTFGKVSVPYGLGSPVFKNPVRVIFKTEKPFCKNRYPPAVSFNDIFRCSLRMSFCDQFWSHIRISFQLVCRALAGASARQAAEKLPYLY